MKEELLRKIIAEAEKAENENRAPTALVEVEIEGMKLSYFTDNKEIVEGNIVTVDGKFEGKIGIVKRVARAFKAPKFEMHWIDKVYTNELSGSYNMSGSDVISLNSNLTSEMFCTMYIGEKYENSDGVGESELDIDLENVDLTDFADSELIASRGQEIFNDNRISFISVNKGMGRAYIFGTDWYELEFRLTGTKLNYIVCNCPYFGNCKHEVALIYKLRELFKKHHELISAEKFVVCSKECFNSMLTLSKGKLELNY